MKYYASSTVFSVAVLLAHPVYARSSRVGQIPNGRNFTCDSCHGQRSLLEEDLTKFGDDVNATLNNGNVNWAAIWNLDSDGDGFTNGLELGDPTGAWRRGQADPAAPTANPGIVNQGICGNGAVEPDEQCDTSPQGQTCQSLGFGEGTLSCHSLCRWDTSECGPCGDGYINPNSEDCDGAALPADVGCADYGFLRGELSCDADCDIDTSTCTDEAPAVCGDGVISTGELCDGDNFGTVDCVRIAYAGGTLECTDDCKWDADNCLLSDGTRVGDEERAAADPGDPFPGGGGEPDASSATTGGGDNDVGASETSADSAGCSAVGLGPGSLLNFLIIAALGRRRRRPNDSCKRVPPRRIL